MKNRCIGKRAYGHWDSALKVSKRMFLQKGTCTAIYECPVCLDFHLTSKWCNTKGYHLEWSKKLVKKKYNQFLFLEEQEMSKNQKLLRSQRRKMKRLVKKIVRIVKPKKNKATKRESTLPLLKQREVIKTLHNGTVPLPKSRRKVVPLPRRY